jgi:hypothetical protein
MYSTVGERCFSMFCCPYFRLSYFRFVVRSQQYVQCCWREVSLFVLLSLRSVVLLLVCCKVRTVCKVVLARGFSLCFVFPTFGCPTFGLLSAPNSMYITVGERCLSLFCCPYFRLSCLDVLFVSYWIFATFFDLFGLLSGPKYVQYCWRGVWFSFTGRQSAGAQ